MPKPVRRPLVMAAVMSAMFMIAIEATIVSTAMPHIAAQLGDLRLYSWVFASFLLAQTATTMVFGKLADLFGRKPVLLVGVAIFLVGSLLCGFALTMPVLIAFRLIQGIGAGAIQPIALTIVGDLYPGHERARVQGYLASVWGVSSVLGPLAGGLITQHLGWAWVFWINIPVGIVAAALFVLYLHEQVASVVRRVDVPGAVLFSVAVAALMAALTELGGATDAVLLAGSVFLVATVLFVLQERRAADPMVAFELWVRRPIASANAATLLAGMALIGLTAFLPMYVQGVLGRSPLVAGFTLTAMSFGWPIGATIAARHAFRRMGLRGTLLLGGALLPLGAAAMLLLRPGLGPAIAGLGSLVMGLGMGFLSTAAIVLIQSTVDWAERGAATASNVFARNLGSTFGATVLGGVLNTSLAHRAGGAVGFEQIRRLLDQPGAVADAAVRAALGHSLHLTFWAMFLITVIAFAAAIFVPRVTLKAPAE
ncbi:MAG TPA: MDR family MFS transporter [Acetobacteraceae bacterium]|nr:MDR family MFS transporter [Acetobacteraceae bacterium]